MITPPVFADEHKTHTARLLYMVLWTYMLAAPFVILISIALPETLTRWILFNGVIYATVPILLGLVRRGHTRLASYLAILEPWGIFTVLAFIAGGMHSPAVSIYPVIIFIAGLILGTRAAIITAGICGLTGLGLIFAERADILPAGPLPHTSVSLWLINVGLLAVVVGIQYVATHTIQQALQKAHQELTEKRWANEALYDSEIRFYNLFMDSIEGICLFKFVYDKQGIAVNYEILDINPQFEKNTDLRRKDVVHKLATEVYGTSESPYLTEYVVAAETDTPYHFETFFAPINKHFYVSVSTTGKNQFAAIFVDITERKKTEEALRTSEERFKRLVESVTDYIYTVKIEDGYPVATLHGPGCIAVAGYSSEEYGADPDLWYRIIHEEDRRAVIDQTIRVAAGEEVSSLEHRIIHKDGTVRWVKNTPAPRYNQEGRLITYDGLIADITERKEAEEALRVSEERFKTEYQGSPIAKFTWEKKGNEFVLTNYNDAANMITREKVVKYVGKTAGEMYSDRQDILDDLHQCYTEKRIIKKEIQSQHFLPGRLAALTYAFVPPKLVIVHAEDITERKEAEQKLLESEERYRTAIEYSNDGVSLVKEGKHIYVNKKYLEIFGYDNPEDVIGKPSALVVHPDYREEQKEYRRRRQEGGVAPERFEFKGIKKDGTEIFIEASLAKIVYRGEQVLFVFSRDITERKQAEEALLKLNAELENRVVERTSELMDLYNNAPCGYHSLDENGHFILINDTELNMFGFERKELIGGGFADILTPESAKTFEENFPVFKEQGLAKNREFDIIRKNGAILPILVNSTAMRDVSGKYFYSRSTILDNSEYKKTEKEIHTLNEELEARAQKLQSINKELESFTYSISHDLKAPLRGIEGYSALLLEDYADKLDADGRTFLHTIRSGTVHMSQLIDDLLAYSRLERRTLIPDNILIPLFVEKLLLSHADEIGSRNITLRVALLEVVLHVDADGLGVALRNLIENAFKFTRDVPAPMIAIACNVTEEKFIIWVKDNGIGFDMAYHDKIFEVFHRLQNSEGYSGTGIGLAMARKAAERMGGRLWAESKPGKGATFYMEIPR